MFFVLALITILNATPIKVWHFVNQSDLIPSFLYHPVKKRVFYEESGEFISAHCPQKVAIPTLELCKDGIVKVEVDEVFRVVRDIYKTDIARDLSLLEIKRSEIRKALPKTSQLERTIQDTEKSINELKDILIKNVVSEIKILEQEKKEILEQISQGKVQIERATKPQKISEQIEALQKQLSDKTTEISNLEEKHGQLTEKLKTNEASLELAKDNLKLTLTSENVEDNIKISSLRESIDKNKRELSAILSDKVREDLKNRHFYETVEGNEDGGNSDDGRFLLLVKAFDQLLIEKRSRELTDRVDLLKEPINCNLHEDIVICSHKDKKFQFIPRDGSIFLEELK